MGPTVFINLDGVVHPVGTRYFADPFGNALLPVAQPFCWLDVLGPIAAERDLRFVLRTSATLNVPTHKLLELAPEWFRDRVDGATDDIYALYAFGTEDFRKIATAHQVIQRYLAKQATTRPISRWLAVDDQDDGWPISETPPAQLVLCDPNLGVTELGFLQRLDVALAYIGAPCSGSSKNDDQWLEDSLGRPSAANDA